MARNFYMVRAMSSTEHDFEIFINKSVVAVGWSTVSFVQLKDDIETLRNEVRKIYYENGQSAQHVIGKKLNEAERFCKIKRDDYIIVPYNNMILLAIATGEFIYSQADAVHDLANQHSVVYQKSSNGLKIIPRKELSEALQRRLRVRGNSVSDLWEFEEEINNLFKQDIYTYQNAFLERESVRVAEFKKILLENIRKGKSNLKAGGIGLEEMVRELFECEGYSAKICSKKRFPGGADADIEAFKSDKFSETKILAQIKHHQGISDDYGLRQLEKIQEMPEYQDYSLAFITTAEIDQCIIEKATNLGIIYMDGNELIEWVFTHLHELSPETKAKLLISDIPQIEH